MQSWRYVVCQGQTNSNIPTKDKPAEEASLLCVWLDLALPAQCLISAPRAAKGENSSLLDLSCPMRQMFGFECSPAGCSSLPFTAMLRHRAGKKTCYGFLCECRWTFSFPFQELLFTRLTDDVSPTSILHQSVFTFPQRLNHALWLEMADIMFTIHFPFIF